MLASVSVGRVGRLVRFGRHTRRRSSLFSRMSSSAASPDAEANEAGASNLCHRLADQIVNGKSSKHNSPRLCLAIAGGGSPALSALTSTPNASSALVEGVVAYDRRSFADYIGAHPPPASAIVSQLTTGQDGIGKSNTSGFSFSSPTAAHLLAYAALHRSLQLSPSLELMRKCVGVGCASALVSQSRPDKRSRAHVVVMRCDGRTVQTDVVLSNQGRTDGGKDGDGRRSRREEDEIVGGVILSSILEDDTTGGKSDSLDTLGLDREGDDIIQASTEVECTAANIVEKAAESIVTGQHDAVVLIPEDKNGNSDESGQAFTALRHPVLPPDPLIFPGSYNPPHFGHVALAQAAVKTMMRKRAQEQEQKKMDQTDPADDIVSSWGKLSSSISDESSTTPPLAPLSSFMEASTHGSVWGAADHAGDDESKLAQPTVLFEMSLTNVDKPPMDISEATRRVNLFDGCWDAGSDDITLQDVKMPDDWGILLTSAPLFVQKVGILGRYVAPSSASVPFLDKAGATKARRKLTFIIGTDTMVRIINPKYYGNSIEEMLAAVREMGDAGVHFAVGGRLEQGKTKGEAPKFVTGEEELTSLPADVQKMFTIIQEEDFRFDLSSTELRKRAAAVGAQK